MTKISVWPAITADGIMFTSLDDETIIQIQDRKLGTIREAILEETGIDTTDLTYHFSSSKDGTYIAYEFDLNFEQFRKQYKRFGQLDFDFEVPVHFTTIEDHDFKVKFDTLLKVEVLAK